MIILGLLYCTIRSVAVDIRVVVLYLGLLYCMLCLGLLYCTLRSDVVFRIALM